MKDPNEELGGVFDPFNIKEEAKKSKEEKPEDNIKPEDEDKPEDNPSEEEEEDFKLSPEELRQKYERIKDFDNEKLEDIKGLIESQEGDSFEEKVENLKKGYELTTKQLQEIKEKEEEREQWFKQNQIQNSTEFKENYQKPVEKDLEYFNTLLSEVDNEGNFKNEDKFAKLREYIFNKGEDITLPKLKAIVNKFSEEYQKAFGEAPDLPSIKEIINARDSLVSSLEKRQIAVNQWEEIREREEKESEIKTKEERQKQLEVIKKDQDEKYKRFILDFDYDSVEDFFPQDEVKGHLSEIKGEIDKLINNERKDFTFTEYLDIAVKAKMFDKLLNESKDLKSFVDEYKKGSAPLKGSKPVNHGERNSEGTLSAGKFFGLIED